jgi:demethylmenaquinone methyltransferase/2-methoxy-6-polyprenyl-1,4-benzoquinol methylase
MLQAVDTRHQTADKETAPAKEGGAGVQQSARKRHALGLFSALPAQYDRAGAVMGFGQDGRWRAAMVSAVQARPAERVLDVATGTGMVAAALVERYGCTVVGLDQSQQMLAAAQARRERDPRLAERLSLIAGEAERLPFEDVQFDHLTFTYLLRYVDDPAATMRELARVVRPGGRVASLEFGVPPRARLRALWSIYTRVGLPTVGALFSREWAQTGRFLARSIPEYYTRFPLDAIHAMWLQAGIEDVQIRRMSFGAGVVMWGTRQRTEVARPRMDAGGELEGRAG